MSVFEFEGDEIVDFLGKLPSAALECPEAYARGTLLNLNVEVRVKSIRLEERQGNLVREHIFAIEAVSIREKIDPQAAVQQAVGGSSSSTGDPQSEPQPYDEPLPLDEEPIDYSLTSVQ